MKRWTYLAGGDIVGDRGRELSLAQGGEAEGVEGCAPFGDLERSEHISECIATRMRI
jgi:hypothetical protein